MRRSGPAQRLGILSPQRRVRQRAQGAALNAFADRSNSLSWGASTSCGMRIDQLAADEVTRFRTLRLAALRDTPEAFGTTHAEASTWTDARWTELFASIVVFVAVVEGEDVGMVRGGSEGVSARIGSLWVRADARRMGVASALLSAVTSWATSEGYERIGLQVGEYQAAARRLYERAGFSAVGVPISYPPPQEGLSRISMTKSLY